jgi:hypothetical protein
VTVGSGLSIAETEKNTHVQNQTIRQLIEGRSNAVGTFTLSTGATTTTVTAPTASPSSVVLMSPMTANAAAAVASTYITSTSVTARQFVVTHVSAGSTDRTFGWVALG